MEKHIEPLGSINETKKPWKTPVLHTRGVEETLGGSDSFITESADYYPGGPCPDAS